MANLKLFIFSVLQLEEPLCLKPQLPIQNHCMFAKQNLSIQSILSVAC